ncbi:PAS domain S-box protein [Halorientalis litorea]|uniref:PAS domain S-box protein n=1 Tax=Halorientalis litorea TaxID=2931977 RepID=UPI001FF264CE|nr:PAS domain S-box protein [Halorientalis litorea]
MRESDSGTAVRVLHVDDEAAVVELAAELLERESDRLTVSTETDPRNAVDYVAREPVDCVVSDYDMPGMNGVEFLQAVRERKPDLPFVLYTGKGSEEIASEAISAGVTDYLQKETGTDQYAILANRIENVVEQHRSKEQLARTRRRLETLVSNLPGMAYRCTPGDPWAMSFVGGRVEALTGYTASELSGGTVTFGEDLIVDEERARLRERVETAVERGDSFEVTYPIETRDGTEKYVWEQGTPLFEDGEPVALEGLIVDVTDRKSDQEELELKNRALDSAPGGVVITDPTRADNPIVYANDTFCEMTGYAESEVLGRNCRFLQGPDTDPELVAEMRAAVEAGESTSVVLRNYRKDGTEFWNNVSISPVTDELGAVTHFVGFQRDITAWKSGDGQ